MSLEGGAVESNHKEKQTDPFAWVEYENSELKNDVSAKLAEQVFSAIEDYREAQRNFSKKQISLALKIIIDACDEYILSIPQVQREVDSFEKINTKAEYDSYWRMKLPEWPFALQILEIQKKAVELNFLPLADTPARARWKIIKSLFPKEMQRGKHLEPEYWREFLFKGEMAIANWVSTRSYISQKTLWSFSEIKKYDSQLTGIDKDQISYLSPLELPNYEITFNRGKAIFRGNLLDTTSSMGVNIETGEVIFAASPDNKVYCSDPNKRLGKGFHHSSFFSGGPVLAAGTMRVENGKIKEITILSGHYQPARKEMLQLLKLLETYHVDLSKIKVVDNLDRVTKNAAEYLESDGYCLPDSGGFVKLAKEALSKKDYDLATKYLEYGVNRKGENALLMKAQKLLTEPNMYSYISNTDARRNIAERILLELASSDSEFLSTQAASLLTAHHLQSPYQVFPMGTEDFKSAELRQLYIKLYNMEDNNVSREQLKEVFIHEMNSIINTKTRITDLFELFNQLKANEGKFIREEKGFFKIFGSEGQTDRWQIAMTMLKERTLAIAQESKIGLLESEQSQVKTILQQPTGRAPKPLMFKSINYPEKYEQLVKEKKIILFSPHIPSRSPSKN